MVGEKVFNIREKYLQIGNSKNKNFINFKTEKNYNCNFKRCHIQLLEKTKTTFDLVLVSFESKISYLFLFIIFN